MAEVLETTEPAGTDDGALSRGYHKVRGDEPPTPSTPEPVEQKEEPKAAETPAEETPEAEPVDPWKDKDPFFKEQFEALNRQLAERDSLITGLRNDLKSTVGRVGALQSALAAAQAARNAGQDAPTQKEVKEAFKTPEGLQELSRDWPEVSKAVTEALAEQRDSLLKELPKQEPIDVEAIRQQAALDARIAAAKELVEERHPGWEEEKETPEFKAWFNSQAPDFQKLGDSSRARDAIKVFDTYAEHKTKLAKAAEAAKRKEERLAAAVIPQGSGAGAPPNDGNALSRGYHRAKGK
jgi:hypothetical protein